jgi:hypothetical protein
MQDPATIELGRRDRLQAMYDQGMIMADIGTALGCTRQRVDQLLSEYGIPRAPQPERFFRSQVEPRRRELERLFLQCRDDGVVATSVGLPVNHVKRLIDQSIPDANLLRRRPRVAINRYGDDELIDSLRFASRSLPEPFSHAAYKEWSTWELMPNDSRARPGPQTACLRYGSWRKALAAAGLPANPTGGPTKTYDLNDGLNGIAAAWKDLGRFPSAQLYDEWHQRNLRYPSSATIRHSAGTWDQALLACWPLVHGRPLPGYGSPETSASDPLSDKVGVPYQPARMDIKIEYSDPFEIDPELLERALLVHGQILHSVATAVSDNGFEPLEPSEGDPLFDLAWVTRSGDYSVVEVKSATPTNLENQLRMGLAQLLKYGEQLRMRGLGVLLALVLEIAPVDPIWISLLDRLSILVTTPENLEILFSERQLGAESG